MLFGLCKMGTVAEEHKLPILRILRVVAGIAAAMIVVWGLLYPSSGRVGLVSPRVAATVSLLVGGLLLAFVLWAYLHPEAAAKSHLAISPFHRWDEKAGLQRDAIRSHCSTCSRARKKRRPKAMKKTSTVRINGNVIFKGHKLTIGLDLGDLLVVLL